MSSSRNRLAQESSPYLQQHASNPVDWYPWSPEALERAREEQLPILLSIGYSSCHWCHVMERESFANDDIAALMNEGFVNIKVDREERPDLDQIYQGALQALGGQGGWPLTVFLTPELEPFFGGTYFPPVPRHGLNSFPQVLQGISAVWNQRRDDVFSSAQQLVKVLGELENPEISSTSLPEREKVIRSAKALAQRFDHEHGGFGNRPKFPGSMNLELWLRLADEEGGEAFVDRVFFSLLKMVQGGIHDHVGGGFHRYSVDERWLIPHFEKMLYDNGLLLSLLARLQRLRPDELWQDTAQRLVEWLFREMRSPQGAFYSAQDADSEGAEGTFFVWNQEELAELLGVEDGRIISELMGVIPGGNFERGKSVLHQAKSAEEVAAGLGIEVAQVESAWKRARGLLLEAREKRPKPFRDEKILVGWNGLAIRGLAEAGRVFAEEDWIAAAVKASDFIHEQMWLEGRLQRVFMAGSVRIPAFADDYALLAEGELALYEATGDSRHFDRSQQLVDQALELFACPDGGAFFLSPKDGEPLVQRPRAIWDNSTPSATSALCHALLRLHALSGEGRYADHAESSLAALSGQALAQPFGFGHLLGAALSAQKGVGVLVLMERDEEEDASGADDSASGSESLELTEKLWKAALNFSAPDVMVLRASPAQKLPPALATLLEGNVEERPALYFCRQGSCSLPVREVEKISSLFSGN